MAAPQAHAPAQQLQGTLQLLAGRLAADGHHLQAIKCYVAMLGQSMLPSDEAALRLNLARLLLEHTLNIQEAKQHLQKAEMLVMRLPGQHLLKCEVLAQLACAHKLLGEADFQRRAYAKGLELCKDTGGVAAADRRVLWEWVVFFHLHTAESLLAAGQAQPAAEQVQAAADAARSHELLEHQVLCGLCQLQLSLLLWDKQASDAAAAAAAALLQQLQQQQQQQGGVRFLQLQLVLKLLQVVMALQVGRFQELCASTPPAAIAELEGIVQQLAQQEQHQHGGAAAAGAAADGPRALLQRGWLPLPVVSALVQLLAAVILKPLGKHALANERISKGLELLSDHTRVLLQDGAAQPGAAAATPFHGTQAQLRTALSLRVLLLEVRLQLALLASNFAAARSAASESIQLLLQFPAQLADAAPLAHLQAGLYAQAVGATDAALAHFNRLAASAADHNADHLAVAGCCLAAMCCLGQDRPNAISQARQYLGSLATEGDADLGYPERCLAHVAGALLTLFNPAAGGSAEERGDAKTRLGKALRMAHTQLQNHQVVSQILLFMAPLQVAAADLDGARSMIVSSTTLSKGAGDLHTQVAGVSMLQQLLVQLREAETAAQNANYVARKQEQLSGAIQAAEADGQEHQFVLGWGL